ncbi:hypothetical protein SEA_PHEROBRINE_28 [Gordonia phage Pherobrine]|nr:hypothetical protein SEA_PHEROBRINE_28 [Gordonia phage Pherobrine]
MIRNGIKPAGDIWAPGKTAQVVLAKHPSGQVREAFPCATYIQKNNAFSAPIDLGMYPMSIMSESNMMGGTVVDGVYRPRLTNVQAKQIRLNENMYDGNEMTAEVVVADIQPIARPSTVILGCNIYGQSIIEVAFGSDGLRIQFTDYENIVGAQFPKAYTIANGDILTIKRVLDVIVIHVNGVYAHSARDATFKPDESQPYVGFSTSSSPTGVSSSIANLKFIGSTYQTLSNFQARYDLERKSVASGSLTSIGSFYIAQGGHCLVMLNDFGWSTNTSFSQREGNLFVNGTREVRVTAQNGGSASKEMTIPPNSFIEVFTWAANAGANDRIVDSGYVEIYPY